MFTIGPRARARVRTGMTNTMFTIRSISEKR
jgi:hypothetical protein